MKKLKENILLLMKIGCVMITLVTAFLGIATFTSCNNDTEIIIQSDTVFISDTIIVDDGIGKVSPIIIDEANTIYLDSIFSKNNNLIPQDSLRLYYIINSKEDLKKINPYDFDINIDFSKYTIIGSRIVNTSISIPFLDKILYYDDLQLKYKYKITFGIYEGVTFPSLAVYYFWDVYPKLKSNYKIFFETAFVNISEK